MSRRSKPYIVVNVGTPGRHGKKIRVIRESEGTGSCDYCNRSRRNLFSYTDDDSKFCNKNCWTSSLAQAAALRLPSAAEIRQANRRAREREQVRQQKPATEPPKLAYLDIARRRRVANGG